MSEYLQRRSDLRPCPFCGGSAEHKITGDDDALVVCSGCEARVIAIDTTNAAAKWNGRYDESVIDVVVGSMTPEGCIEFLARVEGSLTFRRDGHQTIVTISARGHEISQGYSDEEQAAALFSVPVHHTTTACKKLDNQIGG